MHPSPLTLFLSRQYRALTAEFLRLPVTTPNIVQVYVNGLLSSASGGAGSTFAYSSSLTGSVTSITPSAGSIGTVVTIAGTGLTPPAGNLSVIVSGAPCVVTASSSTSITCTVGAGPAGNGSVAVTVGTAGLAVNGTNLVFELTSLSITSVSPRRLPPASTC